MTKGFRCKINDWYGIHQGFNLLLRPGYTALVGPNGAGKSTLLRQIKELAEKRGYDVFWYSNQEDGDTIAMERNVLRGNMSFVAASLCSSEGERVAEPLEHVYSVDIQHETVFISWIPFQFGNRTLRAERLIVFR